MQHRAQIQLPPLGKMSKILIFVLVGVFIAQLVFNVVIGFDAATYSSALSWVAYQRDTFNAGRVWTPLTYMWFQYLSGIFPLVGSALMIYFFGGSVEEKLGRKRMVILFIVSAVAAAIVLHLFNLVMSGVLPMQTATPVLGTSASTSALLGAFCWFAWNADLSLLVVQFKGKHLVYFSLIMSAVSVGLGHVSEAVLSLVGLGIGILAASGMWRPRRLLLRVNLWRTERKLKVIQGRKGVGRAGDEYLH